MATSPSDKLVQEQEVGTDEVVDPAKTTDEEDEARTEEEEVRTEEADPEKTTEEEDEVRTEEDKARTEEEEVRTEDVDPAKTTEEDDEVRTEDDEARTQEVDPAKTTEKEDEVKTEEDEVRTEEEDEPKEEAIESLLESARNLNIEDEETNQGAENQNRQEDPITTHRSDQTMDRGSTSLASDQNRPLDSDPNTSPISLSVQDQGTENQNPQEQSMERSKDGTWLNIFCKASEQNRPLVLPNPPSQHMMMPPRLGPSVPPYQQNPYGLPQPRWLVVDHFYSDGLGLYGAQWRFRTITPFLPNQNTYPHQLVPMELPGPTRSPPGSSSDEAAAAEPVSKSTSNEADAAKDDFVVHLGQVPVRPMMYYQEQNQIVPNAGIQAPARPSLPQVRAPMMLPPVLLYPPPIVNAVPVRPMMNQGGGQRFRFPMIQQHHGSPSAPWPEQNQQLQSPRESQGSNDGPFSSGGSQD
ncbi:hypothetical protein IGI04_032923 [Brassica rapa subsp. trilocularis]|uniref:Uncharacterized protein n=2 Tax=Brassica rapa subsp. trilocularis TaxID=1813537 RepID=A0ABQ7L4E6_BRACM|nr:hypothetical protein IGI04_032923 [Brassica rapa subsp. trilocularis]